MPNLDDELRRRMQRAGRRVRTDGLESRLHARRAHKQITQKAGRGLLAVAVLAGSAVGVAGLNRAFRGEGGPGQVPPGGGSTIAYMRMLRSCDGLTVDRSNTVGPASTDVVAVDVASGDLRVVRSTPLFTDSDRPIAERAPEFSPDGSMMAWADQSPYDLEVTDVATGQTQQVTDGLSVGAPHWSPDGTKLLFAAGERTAWDSPQGAFKEGPDAIYTMNADGTDLRKLTDGTLPIWSPDGRIAFIRTEGFDRSEPGPTGPTSFFVMNSDGSGIEKVYEAPGDVLIRDAEWSPDGTRIAAEATFQGSVDIFVVDLTLRTAIPLTDDPTSDTSPNWSPDGSMIAFQTGRWGDGTHYGETGHSEIAIMNADGSDIRRVTHDCVDDYDPTWLRNDAAVRALPISEHVTASSTSQETPTARLLVSSSGPSGNAALLGGSLEVRNGCVGVGNAGDFAYLIWPAGTTLVRQDGALTVLDGSGAVLAAVGDEIHIGGGIDSLDRAKHAVVGGIPDACREAGVHYWYAGPLVRSDVIVPDVIGLPLKDAITSLEASGLVLGDVQVVTGGYTDSVVVDQQPVAGFGVAPGSTVDVTTGPGGSG